MKTRWVDRIAFWAIAHLFSYKKHHFLDIEELQKFSNQWKDRSHDEFYIFQTPPLYSTQLTEILNRQKFPTRFSFEFPTPFPSAYPQNNHIWAEFHLEKPISQAPLFLIQHGWRSVSVRGYHRLCNHLNRLGINAAVLHLPFHFSRKPAKSFNGELAITSNIVRSADALRQGVQEIRWLKNLFKKMGVPTIGLWGTSYGAWISSIAITLDPDFDGALLLEPPIEIEELFWDAPLFSQLQKELHYRKISRESIRPLFKLVTPYYHPLKINPSRVLILGSKHDPIAHPNSLQTLHHAWKGSFLEIFPYGHISYKLHTSAMNCFLQQLAPQLLKAI